MWKFIRTVAVSAICLLFVGCAASPPGSDDDPGQVVPVPPEYTNVSIAYLKSLYNGHPVVLKSDHIISGTVVSSDDHGNFYKTLVIIDDTGGIELRLDKERIFKEIRPGNILKVQCNSLTLGAYGGLVQLGGIGATGYEVGYISESAMPSHIQLIGRVDSMPAPAEVSIDQLSPRHLSCLVVLRDVQFSDEDRGRPWCKNQESTGRILVDRQGNELVVWTSGHAVFADYLMPSGSGVIEGILSWFNDHYQLRVVDYRKMLMDSERF